MTDQNQTTTEQKVREILADRSGTDIEKINSDTNIQQDLNMDSLDFVEAIMEFEKSFGITIPDVQAEKVKTVRDATELIIELLEKKVA